MNIHSVRAIVLMTSAALLGACGLSGSTGVFHSLIVRSDNAPLDAIGATAVLTAEDSSLAVGTAAPTTTVTWVSSDPSVATVGATGTSVTVTAKANGSVTITATNGALVGSFRLTVAQVVTGLAIVSGDQQTGSASTLLPLPLVVKAVDRLGGGVAAVGVTFTPQANSGSVAPTTGTTAANGTASTRWTFGPSQIVQKVDVTSAGLAKVTFSGTAGP